MKRVAQIIGIDVGYANLAMCGLDPDWRNPVIWTNERILEGKYTEEGLWQATFAWCKKHQELLENACMIVLERQIDDRFKVMNAIIRTLHPSLAVVVAPATIGAKFGLRRTRKEKKEDAIRLVGNNLRIVDARKKDDLADAFLLAFWGLQKLEYSAEGWEQ